MRPGERGDADGEDAVAPGERSHFCSKAVAAFYQHMGWMDAERRAHSVRRPTVTRLLRACYAPVMRLLRAGYALVSAPTLCSDAHARHAVRPHNTRTCPALQHSATTPGDAVTFRYTR